MTGNVKNHYTNVKCYFLKVREYIQKFPDWVDNEINNNKHSLRNNTKGYGGKTH